jgi:uncharacterized Zn finger protein (UPF0148 family)
MMPANTEVTCPCCDSDFTIKKNMEDDDTVHCANCDVKLILIDGDLEEYDEDIYEEPEEEEFVDDDDEDAKHRP